MKTFKLMLLLSFVGGFSESVFATSNQMRRDVMCNELATDISLCKQISQMCADKESSFGENLCLNWDQCASNLTEGNEQQLRVRKDCLHAENSARKGIERMVALFDGNKAKMYPTGKLDGKTVTLREVSVEKFLRHCGLRKKGC